MNNFKDIAINAAKQTGKILLKMQKKDVKYEMKNEYDILAEADLAAEKIILSAIKENFPDHAILSEEAGEIPSNSPYLWLVDPLDGTINFSRKRDEYCISIALEFKGELILGIIYQPQKDRLYVAEKNKGAFFNGQPIRVSENKEIISMFFGSGTSPKPEFRKKAFRLLATICNDVRAVRIMGSAALELMNVAIGTLDVFYHIRYSYFDYAAGALLIEEAGGKVTDFAGQKIGRDSKDIVATNGKIHDEILDILNKNRRVVELQNS